MPITSLPRCFCHANAQGEHPYGCSTTGLTCPDEPVPDPRKKPARHMALRIHFLAPGTLAEEVQFGDELQQGRDWRWRGDELIIRRNDGNRCEYPARNIRCVEIDKGGAS